MKLKKRVIIPASIALFLSGGAIGLASSDWIGDLNTIRSNFDYVVNLNSGQERTISDLNGKITDLNGKIRNLSGQIDTYEKQFTKPSRFSQCTEYGYGSRNL